MSTESMIIKVIVITVLLTLITLTPPTNAAQMGMMPFGVATGSMCDASR